MGVGGVFVWVNRTASKRMSLLEEQLPDSIELMVRSLRVGHPFSTAIGIVAKEIPDPLGSEFGVIADEAAYGRDVTESLKAFAERMDSQDLRFLAVAVSIQQQSGGNLAEILEGLSKVVRARFKLFRRVARHHRGSEMVGHVPVGLPDCRASHDQRRSSPTITTR
jgi:tight adherence protein B